MEPTNKQPNKQTNKRAENKNEKLFHSVSFEIPNLACEWFCGNLLKEQQQLSRV